MELRENMSKAELSKQPYIPLEDGELCPIFLKLPPENIVLFKFLMEGYDGLGIGRTLDPARGEVVFLALRDTVHTALDLIQNIAGHIGLTIIPPPQSVEDDWLLAEYAPELRSR